MGPQEIVSDIRAPAYNPIMRAPLPLALSLAAALAAVTALAQRRPARPSLVGQAAPRVVVQLHDGRTLDTATLAGRPYVVDFWGPACGPCRGMVPYLNAAHRRLARAGSVALGVVAQPMGPGEHARTRRAWRIAYPTGTPLGGDPTAAYGVERLPAMFAVGRDGRVAYDDATLMRRVRLDEAVTQLLAAPGGAATGASGR